MNEIECLKEDIERLKYKKAIYEQEMDVIYSDVMRGMFRGKDEYNYLEKRYKHLGIFATNLDKEIAKKLMEIEENKNVRI